MEPVPEPKLEPYGSTQPFPICQVPFPRHLPATALSLLPSAPPSASTSLSDPLASLTALAEMPAIGGVKCQSHITPPCTPRAHCHRPGWEEGESCLQAPAFPGIWPTLAVSYTMLLDSVRLGGVERHRDDCQLHTHLSEAVSHAACRLSGHSH